MCCGTYWVRTLQWRHNERDGVSNHRRLDCLPNRLFRRGSKKTSKLSVTGLCEGKPPVTGGFPHKGPATRKMFPFDDVIMIWIGSGSIIIQFCPLITQPVFTENRRGIGSLLWVQILMHFLHFDGLVQKRPKSSALALESHPFCTKPSITYNNEIPNALLFYEWEPKWFLVDGA